MRFKPELPPREIDVPCLYRQTSVCRSASLHHDPYVLVSFSTSAASYALEAYDKKEDVVDYIKGEFARLYGGTVEAHIDFTFRGNHMAMDVHLDAEVPAHLSIEAH